MRRTRASQKARSGSRGKFAGGSKHAAMPALANARGTVPAQHCIAQPCRRSGVLRQHSLGHTGASSIANAGSNVLRGSRQRSGFRVSAAAGPSDKKPVQLPVASNPTEAVELGTQLFKEGKAAQAVQLFTSALGEACSHIDADF